MTDRQSDNIEIDFGTIPHQVTNRCYCRSFPERHKNVDWLNFYRFQLGLEQTKP